MTGIEGYVLFDQSGSLFILRKDVFTHYYPLTANKYYPNAYYCMIKNNFLMHTSFRILMTTLGSIFCLTMASGQSLFQRLYAVGDSMTSGYFITEAPSGNIIVSGTINRGNALYDGILWMLDPAGNPLWTLKIGRGTADELRINDVLATPDGGYNSIVKLNSLGATEWVKKTAVPSYLEFRSILKITGGYLITGSNLSVGAPVIKVDESGNFVWGQVVNGYDYFGEGATAFPNGDILIPGGAARGSIGQPVYMDISQWNSRHQHGCQSWKSLL